MRRILLGLSAFLAFARCPLGAEPGGEELPVDRGAAGLWQALIRLQTTGTVLHLTAHPDDEDAALLTALARGQGLRTVLLSLTRGEGGANVISPHFFDALGLLRTLELLEAGRRYGVEQFFTRAVDYGFSKSIEEAVRSWGGEEEVLSDVVRVVRRTRPDVIVARFRGDPRDGHGHHMFSGLMAQRVFDAAADPSRFPEQIAEGLEPWQVKRLYVPASRSGDPEGAVASIQTGTYDPLLGKSYAQLGREGYAEHRSQGMSGRPAPAGPAASRYRLLRAVPGMEPPPGAASFFEGLDTSLAGIARLAQAGPPPWLPARLEALQGAVKAAVERFDARAPESSAAALASGLAVARALAADVRGSELAPGPKGLVLRAILRKVEEIEAALSRALALDLDASAEADEAPAGGPPFGGAAPVRHLVPGESVRVRVRMVNRSPLEVRPTAVALRLPSGWRSTPEDFAMKPLGTNEVIEARFRVEVPLGAAPTRPGWHRDSIEEKLYRIASPEARTLPFPPPPLWAEATVVVLGEALVLAKPVRAAVEEPGQDFTRPPLVVVSPLSVEFTREHGVFPLGSTEYPVAVRLRSSVRAGGRGEVRLRLPPGWRSEPAVRPFAHERADAESTHDFILYPPPASSLEPCTITAVAALGGEEHGEGFTTITARGLGGANLYRPAVHHVRGLDVKVAPGLRVGYVMGSGDDVPRALELLGVRAALLGEADLAGASLDSFDTILIGVRAYAVRTDLKTSNQRLLDYVQNGGVLIVQYQTPEFDRNYGPYPYTMTWGAEEVSEEDSPVTMLEPDNVLFRSPNAITPKDFDGWVEERGSKFWKTWDERYTPLLETHDRGQPPQRGGMLIARHGKGAYVYSAYAWYRQLPFGVPGAFRIFANLISLPRTLETRGAAR